MHAPTRALLAGLIDYAGLFPPASLSIDRAVEEYARHLRSDDAWMLGTFICPAAKLREFSRAAAMLLPGTHATSGYREMTGGEPWRISALIGDDLAADLEIVHRFNDHHSVEDHGLAVVATIEMKVQSASDIDRSLDMLPEHLSPFFEIPVDRDCRGMVAALAGEDAAAKVRCGGVQPSMIPPIESVAAFIEACAQAGVPFKATAGLHHPVRSEHALSYAADAPRGVMHGFLNVFLGAALLRAGEIDRRGLERILDETDPSAFRSSENGISWRDRTLDVTRLSQAREHFAISYGSCSFDEPTTDLRSLGWL
ncbi:MAG: hypothetical protein KF866_11940 [Phycisphaeraceae bacterium]|nr:hypothetical protein [Phycisphaeraceae bacterium]MCW5755246.1 hypothetical protein [Phycisphaeraceae bacterium]